MTDNELLKASRACCDDYLWKSVDSLLPWIKSRGALDDATTAKLNVHGVGIAFKQVGGRKTNDLCVRVSVLRKMSPEQLQRAGGLRIPAEIAGVPIDVVESGPIVIGPQLETEVGSAEVGPDPLAVKKFRPLRPGCSIEFGDTSFGTLGAFCRSTRPADRGKVFMLSCRHVLATFSTPMQLEPIFQPGRPFHKDARSTAVAGRAVRVVESQPGGSIPHFVADAAIAPLRAGIDFSSDNLGIGVPAGIDDLLAREATQTLVAERYCKFGRMTGLTVGVIDVARHNTKIEFHDGPRFFEDTFVVQRVPDSEKPISVKGDSGAMMFRQATRQAAGLVIGGPLGTDEGESTVVSPIAPILKALEIELV
jgi:hypothetical protein